MKFQRRQALAAATGASLFAGTPWIQSLYAQLTSSSAKRPPLRFVFCIKSNGLWAEMIQPHSLRDKLPFQVKYDERGRLVNGNHGNVRKKITPPAELELALGTDFPEVMSPLKKYHERISILQGLNSGFSTYHMGCYQTLGAFQGRNRNSRETLGATVDSVLGRAFPGPIPHVCLGHDPKSPAGVAYIPTSAVGRGKPIAFYTRPKRAYQDLFGVVDSGDARKSYDTQTDILDFYSKETKRLQNEIATEDREQLDRYLNAFESIRQSRQAVERISANLKKFAPQPPVEIKADATMQVGAGNTDIAIASLLSGLTNVVTLRFDLLGSSSYEGIGGLHGGVGHGQVKDIVGARHKICNFHFQQIARIADALDKVPEGAGTMLDNTVFIYTSDNGETHHSSGVNYPVMLLGDLGGRLATRRYFAPGNEQTDRSQPGYVRLGDLWATLLAAAGQPYKKFGIPVNSVPHSPIESLLNS